jgi:Zinc finger C-x8-C-x5-C-x3-H type (and similar)
VNTAFGESGYAADGGYGDSASLADGSNILEDEYGDGSAGYYSNAPAWADGNGYSHGYNGNGFSAGEAYGYAYGGHMAHEPGGSQYEYATAMGGFPLYKTQLCYSFMNTGVCPKALHCPYAHGHHELVGCTLVHASS